MSREELLEAALALSAEDRIALSLELLESVDPADEAMGELWFAEAWPDVELDRDDVTLAGADEVFAAYDPRFDR